MSTTSYSSILLFYFVVLIVLKGKHIKVFDTGDITSSLSCYYGSSVRAIKFLNLSFTKIKTMYEKILSLCRFRIDHWEKTLIALDSIGWYIFLKIYSYQIRKQEMLEYITTSYRIAEILLQDSVIVEFGGNDSINSDHIISSLVQILIDPYYRTPDGLITLFFKEWINVG